MITNWCKGLIYLSVFLLTACGSSPAEPESNGQKTSALEPVSNFQAVAGDGQVSLSWENPSNAVFKGTVVIRKTGSYPTGPTDGTEVYRGNDNSKVDTGLTNGATYYYAAFRFDAAGNYSTSVSASCTPGSGTTRSDYSSLNLILVSIPGGTFQMGSNNGESNERPVHQVTVSAFQMSAKEITNSQYAAYLNAALVDGEIYASIKRVTGAKGDYNGREYIDLDQPYDSGNPCWISFNGTVFGVSYGKENLPVVYVSWYGAKAFADKYGLDLPREAEWEYAARGGKGYEYGTDDGTIGIAKANYRGGWGSSPKNVGSYPANPFGLYDLAGNAWEWCNDWYGTYSDAIQTNPTGPSSGSYRIMRGGDFILSEEYECLFRSNRPVNQELFGRWFRAKSASCSGRFRPPEPERSDADV